jgi:hypothetical protein
MTDDSYLPPEAKAYKAFLHWLAEGRKVWETFDQEGVPIPETLKRALTDKDAKQGPNKGHSRPTRLRPPEAPEKPRKADDDWIWNEASEASFEALVLAILSEGKPLPIKELITRVKQFHPNLNEGSLYNVVGRLNEENKIQKGHEGWHLKNNSETTPILHKGHIWAPRNLLQKQDLAAFRRMAIRHVLGIRSDGLQVMQIFRELEGADWLDTPLSKDLVKADLSVMKKEGKVKRFGSEKKWKLDNSNE